ncbi:MAG: hypothetical protein IPJ77_00155 [Planctomycetes bacterium]|nr:hypothetical protein [Planctomycetota bacterium]
MLLIALLLVLQTPAGSPPAAPKAAEPVPTASELELPPGARVLYAIDGHGLDEQRIDHLGKGLTALGDMNGDGTPDFLAGSVSGVPGLTQERGFAEVRSGKDGAVLLRVDGLDRSTKEAFGGDGFGIRVGALPDLDGDGVGEFFVGGEPGIEAPYLKVYSGKGAAVLRVFTSGEGQLQGLYDPYDLRPIGDLDGDGRDDFALVCDSKTCVLAGGSWKPLRVLDGECVGRSGDFDGDGARDVFCRFQGWRPAEGCSAGIVSIQNGRVLAKTKFPDAGSVQRWSWASAGDANGDGFLDAVFFFYDSPRTTWTSPAKERRFLAQIVSGKDATVLREWWEELETEGDLGDVRFVGDLDGDGCDELAIGHATGQGSVSILSGKDGKRLVRVASKGWSFGVRVARLGDVDGDGCGELAIGEHEHGKCAGRVWVISLRNP